jgi:hypothetical protein
VQLPEMEETGKLIQVTFSSYRILNFIDSITYKIIKKTGLKKLITNESLA